METRARIVSTRCVPPDSSVSMALMLTFAVLQMSMTAASGMEMFIARLMPGPRRCVRSTNCGPDAAPRSELSDRPPQRADRLEADPVNRCQLIVRHLVDLPERADLSPSERRDDTRGERTAGYAHAFKIDGH